MTLEPGATLGPYRIEAPIGSGGMGAVWKARDTRLDRTVAIKTIEGEFNERFEREAKTIASLNHPHICTLHDVGDGYLVMEYIDGAPLKGPLPAGEVARLGAQIAEALDAAHRKGITHRDLKPGNVLVTKAGGIKVIDFGLAKGGSPVRGEGDVTLTKPLTGEGTILGTVPYMSPEQLQGQEADARSDIFALGCVLHEMLTGKRAFDGKSQVSIMAAILEHEPAPLAGPVVPAWLDRIIRRCLRKNPDQRWQSAGDIAIELREPHLDEPGAAQGRTWLPWAIAAGVTAAALAWGLTRTPAATATESGETTRLSIEAPENTQILGLGNRGSASISPDGRSVVFITRNLDAEQRELLYIRPLASLEPRALPSDPNPRSPCWSPDSRWIAYRSGTQIKKVEVAGGRTVTILTDSSGLLPNAWSRDGGLLLSGASEGTIMQLDASGGVPRPVTRLDTGRRESRHSSPAWLPGGRRFVFNAYDVEDGPPAIYVASLDSPVPKRIGVGARPQPVRAGGRMYLVYARNSDIVAQEFDAGRLELGGPVHALADVRASASAALLFSASDRGSLAIAHGRGRRLSEPLWITRGGASRPAGPVGSYRQPRLAAGANTAILERSDSASAITADIWMLDTGRGVLSRLLGEMDRWEYHPIWSPDGAGIIYAVSRNFTNAAIRRRLSDGNETVLLNFQGPGLIGDWSPDGSYFVFSSLGIIAAASATGKADQRAIRLTNSTDPRERYPRISPDGKWVAFGSTESGASQVYVVPFDPAKPVAGSKFPVSTGGGDMPAWRGDGKEIFYVAPDGTMMAAPVSGLGPTPRFGAPQALFQSGIDLTMSSYDVTPDGQRFLVLKPVGPMKTGSVEVVVNWPGLIAPGQRE